MRTTTAMYLETALYAFGAVCFTIAPYLVVRYFLGTTAGEIAEAIWLTLWLVLIVLSLRESDKHYFGRN